MAKAPILKTTGGDLLRSDIRVSAIRQNGMTQLRLATEDGVGVRRALLTQFRGDREWSVSFLEPGQTRASDGMIEHGLSRARAAELAQCWVINGY